MTDNQHFYLCFAASKSHVTNCCERQVTEEAGLHLHVISMFTIYQYKKVLSSVKAAEHLLYIKLLNETIYSQRNRVKRESELTVYDLRYKSVLRLNQHSTVLIQPTDFCTISCISLLNISEYNFLLCLHIF